MELKLDSLIDKIKVQGIEEGERTAKDIVSKAEQEAQDIINKAKEEAKSIIDTAKQESDRMFTSGKDGLKQAQRDLLLSLETKLVELGNKFVSATTVEALDSVKLADIIKTALSNWNFDSNDTIFVHLSSDDAKNITQATLAGAVKSGQDIEIKVDNSISSGFRISKGDGGYAFDFTASSISEALSTFLTPNIRELLK